MQVTVTSTRCSGLTEGQSLNASQRRSHGTPCWTAHHPFVHRVSERGCSSRWPLATPGRRSDAGRASRRQVTNSQRGLQNDWRRTVCMLWPVRMGPRGRIRTDDLPITSRRAFVQRVPPRPVLLLRSAGSSSQCVPDLPCSGRGNDQGDDRRPPPGGPTLR